MSKIIVSIGLLIVLPLILLFLGASLEWALAPMWIYSLIALTVAWIGLLARYLANKYDIPLGTDIDMEGYDTELTQTPEIQN